MNNPKLQVDFAGISLRTPLVAASGTFGFGREYSRFGPLDDWGAIVGKGLTLRPSQGNPPPRVTETPAGMLNSIGLQNPGVEAFLRDEMPDFASLGLPVLANISGHTVEEYGEIAAKLEGSGIAGIEVNVSCPNVKAGGIVFGTDPKALAAVTRAVRRRTGLPVIVKLSPNVTDVVALAQAAEGEGADGLSMINTLLGMAIDIHTRRPILANTFGGLSGPAIKPVALRMIWQVYRAVKIPILGMGGITCAADAIEFLLAGASAVAVGTGIFHNPGIAKEIREGIQQYIVEKGFASVTQLVGAAHQDGEGKGCGG
ncbi:MAG TPA: dihydroorotate dehydrogenase [Firmicutes bacterium]|jgi:dihydroorotate dehydrogenase (NAD+) catalytic subunit|nr:dihydroorotate dehydrogenase [Bacillota bacterium]HOQ24080.1 dihydroorotate dehydrogenase [Bacillota bacterium]HPT67516.1 dihydroorotate dehydrogenase [Bacillota bacterium]